MYYIIMQKTSNTFYLDAFSELFDYYLCFLSKINYWLN